MGEPCPDTEDPFDAMFNAVTDGLRKLFPPDDVGRAHSPDTMFWNTASRAKQARSIARMIQKQFESNRPWPEWALKAKAEGWKPPRGWKP